MADIEEYANWKKLLEAVQGLEHLNNYALIDAAVGECLELYRKCLDHLLGENDEDLYVTARRSRISPTDALDGLELHFGQYRANSTIDQLIALFSLKEIKEEANESKYHSTLTRQLDNSADEVAAFADRLGDPSITLQAAFAPAAQKPVSFSAGLSPEARLGLAVTQIAVLSQAAAGILKADTTAAQIWRAQLPAGAGGQQATTTPGPRNGLASDVRDRLARHGATFARILAYVRVSKLHLDDLARVLRDQRVRDRVWDYLRPLARYYEERAGRQPGVSWRTFWLIVAAVSGGGTYLLLWNAFLPNLGPPTVTATLIAVAIGYAVGWLTWRGRAKDRLVKRASERLRAYVQAVLRIDDQQQVANDGEILSILNKAFAVQVADPAAPQPRRRLRDIVMDSIWPDRENAGGLPKWRGDDGEVRPIWFAHAGSVEAGPLVIGGSLLLTFVSAVAIGLIPALPRAGVALVPPRSDDTQIISYAAGRETCELARGRIVWQDDSQIFLAGKDTTIAVKRDQIAQIRYFGTDSTIQPCRTQDDFYGKTDIHVDVPEPKVQIIQTPTVDGQPDVTVATMPVTMQIPALADKPAHSVLEFYSNVFVDGVSVPVSSPEPDKWAYVILPIFVDEVKQPPPPKLDPGRKAYDDFVYHFAVCRSDLGQKPSYWCDDPGAPRAPEAKPDHIGLVEAIEPIKEALATQRQQGCSIAIDVRGFASEKGFDGADDSTGLNWRLAEGRRVAVLLALGINPEDGKFQPNEGKTAQASATTTSVGMLDLVPAAPVAGLSWPARFADYNEMHTGLESWLHPVGISQEAQDRFAEAFRRSVVIAIWRADLAGCRPPDEPPQEMIKAQL